MLACQKSIDFASRFPPRHLETCRPEISEIDIGTIKNGFAASDLPPEGPKKKRWADLTHLVHFADLAELVNFGHFADVLNITSPAEGVPT